MTESASFRCLRAVALPLLAVATLIFSGCGSSGGDGTIPEEQLGQATDLKAAVEAAGDAYENQDCEEADAKLVEAQEIADGLDVDSQTHDNINELLNNLDGLQTSCTDADTTSTSSSTSSTTETSSTADTSSTTDTEADTDTTKSTTTSSTTPSVTTTSSTTTTPEPPTTSTTPTTPGNGGGDDGGGVGGTAPRKTHDDKAGKGSKKDKGSKKRDGKKTESKRESGGAKP